MTYPDAIEFLYRIRLFGQKLGLETMRELLLLLGEPQRQLRFLHVAGTNGKGSVAAMMQAVLTAAGHKTGLYSSPHLVSFCERFQIDGQPIGTEQVTRLVAQTRPWLDRVAAQPGLRAPTFFETVTAMALQYFREQAVDAVAWETGLGGRLDATNVVTPLVSVITNIGLDHTQYLGDTLAAIAAEKCGIIKPGAPVVTAVTDPGALAVVRQTAARAASPLRIVAEAARIEPLEETLGAQRLRVRTARADYGALELPLPGAHQATNCATAIVALEASGLVFQPEHVRRGLRQVRWPGRFQVVPGTPTVVLDGAHNPAAAGQLAATLTGRFAPETLALIIGVLRDKDCARICEILAPLAGRIFCVPVNSERTSEPGTLAAMCAAANPAARVSVCDGPAMAFQQAGTEGWPVVLITGSLFLVGEAISRLELAVAAPLVTEKELVLQ
jgi:dihydrofolate synthase/folylpolyglutamate synthase